VLVHQDPPPSTASPGSRAVSGGALPGGAVSPAPGASDKTSTYEKSADGGAKATAAASNSRAAASGSADPGHRDSPPAATARASTPGAQTPSAGSTTSPDAATPPWISGCTYYSGNGRTREGDSGNHVLQVQCMLTKRGYDVGSTGVDGEFGADTESAVESFQGAR